MQSKRVSGLYVSAAVLLANTLVIFLVLNVMAKLALSVYGHFAEDNPVTEKYGEEKMLTSHPGMKEAEVRALLHETWSRPYVYEPFTQFRERPYHGTYVNVDENGYRHGKDQAAWPPPAGEINIFLFGGSTTFGYGVPDSQTIGSCLQQDLRDRLHRKANIYNFGRGFYFSTQERILFEQLLVSGFVPDLAVFVDGLNEFYHYKGKPFYTDDLSRYLNGEAREATFVSELPLTRLADALLNGYGSRSVALSTGEGKIRYDDQDLLDEVIARYVANKKLIETLAAAYGARAAFIWQPVPTYNYDLRYHLFARKGFERHTFSRYGYPKMKAFIAKHPQGTDFLWAADLQQGLKQSLYVDKVHYTAEFSSRFADYISDFLAERYFQGVSQ